MNEILERRSRPRLILLDHDLRVLYADWTALFTVARLNDNPVETFSELPPAMLRAVQEAVNSWDDGGSGETAIDYLPDVVLRVMRVEGDTIAAAISLESRVRAGDVAKVADTYELDDEERHVLALLLRGYPLSAIADELFMNEAQIQTYAGRLAVPFQQAQIRSREG
jgi:hypothetical protein